MDQLKEWYYLNHDNTQKGPVPSLVLLTLIEKGILPVNTMIWKNGLSEWQSISNIDPFKKMVEFVSAQWYYVNREGQQQGPILSTLLVSKLKEGSIDGLTLVYSNDHCKEWTKLSEVSYLKEYIQKSISNDDDDDDNSKLPRITNQNTVTNFDIQAQTFNLDDEYLDQPVYPFQTKKPVSASSSSSVKKVFTADDGLKYLWDEEEQDWVEYDGDSGDEDEEEDNDDDDDDKDERKRDKKKVSFNDNDKNDDTTKAVPSDNNDNKQKKRKRKNKKGPNTWVYVTGLPADVTTEEIQSHFGKVGLIALNPLDQQPKIKIYRTDDGECKGDCSIGYNAIESVKMALDILHDGYIRPTHKIQVTQAEFEIKDKIQSSSSKRAPTSNVSQAQIKTAQRAMKQALAWNEDDDIGVNKSQALKIIVLEGMFDPIDFANDPKFEEELEKDIVTECEKFGQILKMTLFSKNPRGIVIVKFNTGYAAQETIKLMNGRFFSGKKIKAYYWDGKTDYTVSSSSSEQHEEEEEDQRLNEFGDWLDKDQEDLPEEFQLRTED